jgi:hypothetical protein
VCVALSHSSEFLVTVNLDSKHPTKVDVIVFRRNSGSFVELPVITSGVRGTNNKCNSILLSLLPMLLQLP